MSSNMSWNIFAIGGRTILAATMIAALVPLAAQAGQSRVSTCGALVSVSNDLYLVNSTGKVLTQFTSDGTPKTFATISPNGDKIAYASGQTANTFEVVNKFGQQGVFSINLSDQSTNSNNDTANNYLTGLSWTSNNTLRLVKSFGKDYAQFEFRRISDDLSSPSSETAKPAVEQNCVIKRGGGLVACIDQAGDVSLGGNLNGESIYSVSGFKDVTPLESLTAHVGEGVTPQVGPPYKVTIESISKNKIMINMDTSNPDYASGAYETQIENGSYAVEKDYNTGVVYGYLVSVINAKTGLVRIDVAKSNVPENPFDTGLAWRPDGDGLIFIQHTNTQTFLDLIQPGRSDAGDHPAKGQGPQWHLAAQTPVSLPGKVRSIRFLTSSLLLLDTGDYRGPQFSELPIQIANGRDDGKPALTVGLVQPLPSTLSVTINGKNLQGSVLGWSCEATNGDGD